MGRECKRFYARLAEIIANKRKVANSITTKMNSNKDLFCAVDVLMSSDVVPEVSIY